MARLHGKRACGNGSRSPSSKPARRPRRPKAPSDAFFDRRRSNLITPREREPTRRQREPCPPLIQFSSGDSITVKGDYDRVNSDLHSSAQGGQFKRVDSGNDARVTIYTANVSYIQETEGPDEPYVV